jgi:hypothetical protein
MKEIKFWGHDESFHYEPVEVHDGEKWGGKIMQKVEDPLTFEIEIPLDEIPMNATHLRLSARFHMEGVPPNGHHCEGGGWVFALKCPDGTTVRQIDSA